MKPIETRVESVTLYHRGATVRRVAPLDVTQGLPKELFLAGLPLSLADHTVRVRVETDGGEALVSNVRIGLYAPPRGTPALPPEQQQLREVHDSLAVLRDRLAQLDAETQRLVDVGVLPRPEPEEGQRPPPAPMGARVALEQLFEEAVSKRLVTARELRDQVKALETREQQLHRALQLASTAQHVRPDELQKSIHASLVSTATPKQARLVVEYFVLAARWAPSYQCRMTRDCTSADLQLRGLVCQRTGEDWRGVTLLLSTASPLSWTELPELGAIKIGMLQPPPPGKRGFRPPPQGAGSLFHDYDREVGAARTALPVIPSWQPPALDAHPLPTPRPRGDFAEGAVAASPAELDASYDEEVVERRRESSTGSRLSVPARAMAMPPPAPMAAPAPMPLKKMKAGPPGAAARGGMAKMAEMADLDDEGGDGFAPEAPGASLEVVLYASLRLPDPTSSLRGALTPVDRRQAFHESLQQLGLVAPFDVLSVVQRAEAQGQELFSAPAPQHTVDVRSEAGWYDYVYATDAAVDVPSDGTFHSVPVNTRTATSEVLYVAVPREDPQVYRQAQVRNPLSSPLLPGPVEVSVGGEYVLTTQLPSVAPGGDFKLSLGVEQGIKIARNAKFAEQRSGDKVVATNELIHELDLEVVNNLERPALCEVRERVPQPAPEAEVVVQEHGVKPPWEPYRQQERGAVIEGGRKWLFTVKPGATQKLQAQYRVKLYANNELVGGNRREA